MTSILCRNNEACCHETQLLSHFSAKYITRTSSLTYCTCEFHLTDKTGGRSGGDKAGLESNKLDLQAAVVADASALNWTDKANLELNLHSLI